jgi:hypothetical protein
MTVTFKFVNSCAANHVDLEIYTGGVLRRTVHMAKTDFTLRELEDEEIQAAAVALIRNYAKENNLNTIAKIKAGVEAHAFEV